MRGGAPRIMNLVPSHFPIQQNTSSALTGTSEYDRLRISSMFENVRPMEEKEVVVGHVRIPMFRGSGPPDYTGNHYRRARPGVDDRFLKAIMQCSSPKEVMSPGVGNQCLCHQGPMLSMLLGKGDQQVRGLSMFVRPERNDGSCCLVKPLKQMNVLRSWSLHCCLPGEFVLLQSIEGSLRKGMTWYDEKKSRPLTLDEDHAVESRHSRRRSTPDRTASAGSAISA
ncbi:hypothetical protein CERSUDRAFT_125850, partial [Gelatoporia subvermispora B]